MSNYYSETSNNLINNTIFKIHNQEFRWKELMWLNPEYYKKYGFKFFRTFYGNFIIFKFKKWRKSKYSILFN